MKLHIIVTLVFCFSGLLNCGKPEEPPVPASKPSVLLITLDTLRADRLGCYSGKGGLTPNLDSLARRSTCFQFCEASVPLTLPSHVSILSGWEPLRHGIRNNIDHAVGPEVPLLAEEFRKAGYDTAAFISASVLLRRYGLDRGFEVYDQSFHNPVGPRQQEAPAERTLGRAMDWLEQCRTPFFCWIHLYDPHFPYLPPEPYCELFKDSPYDGEVAYLDEELGRFFDEFQGLPADRETILLICGDHGESLGEHGEEAHGVFLYESAMRVPLIVHLPGQRDPGRHFVKTSLVDVAPTLRGLTGLDALSNDGLSLAPFLQGNPYLPVRPLFTESMQGLLTYGWSPLYGVVKDRWKYILAPRPELYDLEMDPDEMKNLFDEHPDVARDLHGELLNHQERVATAAVNAPDRPLTEEEMSGLASLGYIGSSFSLSFESKRDPKDYIHLEQPLNEVERLLFEQKHAEALRILRRIAVEDPENSVIHYFKGAAYEPSDLERAIQSYKAAISYNPAYEIPWSSLMRVLLNSGRVDEAAQMAGEGLGKVSDRYGMLHIALAEFAFLQDKPESEIMPHIEAALRMDPHQGRAYLLRGLLHNREGRQAAMENDMKTVWKYTTPEKLARWSKDPALKEVF